MSAEEPARASRKKTARGVWGRPAPRLLALLAKNRVGLAIDLRFIRRAQAACIVLARCARLGVARMRLVLDGIAPAGQRELVGRKLLAFLRREPCHDLTPPISG